MNGYHTVAIRSDLPTIPKDYPDESIEIQPPNDFWMKVFKHINVSSSSLNQIDNYQIQYNATNGPCEISQFREKNND